MLREDLTDEMGRKIKDLDESALSAVICDLEEQQNELSIELSDIESKLDYAQEIMQEFESQYE